MKPCLVLCNQRINREEVTSRASSLLCLPLSLACNQQRDEVLGRYIYDTDGDLETVHSQTMRTDLVLETWLPCA
jgi:hypothetical protein